MTINTRLKLVSVFFIALIFAVFFWWQYLNSSKTEPNVLTLYGNIDIRQVELSFQDPEHITEIFVHEGDRVKKDDFLAVQDLERFQYAVESAEAKFEVQQQVLLRLLTGSRPEDIRKAQADVKAAEAEVQYAKKELDRMQILAQQKLLSKEVADRARADLDEAQAKWRGLKELQALAVIGPRKEDIAAAKAQLKAEASALKLAKKVWQDAHLYAPSDGIIQDRILEPGDMATAQIPVFTLALTDPVWARVYVSEIDLGKLRSGMEAEISTDSYPGKRYKGWVGYISPTSEFTPKAVETTELRSSLVYQVRVYACNPQNQLRLGMPVTVTIPLTTSNLASDAIKTCSEQ
jgi:HlyD family secretion protein